jgi:hypothetical protein
MVLGLLYGGYVTASSAFQYIKHTLYLGKGQDFVAKTSRGIDCLE